MARNPSPGPAQAGSRYWLEEFVNRAPAELDKAIGLGPIEWLSPLVSDEHAEYRDEAFLVRLRLDPTPLRLHEFWPSGGPRWDALGITAAGDRVLLEAKSSIDEMFSSARAASPEAMALIVSSLARTAAALGAGPGLDWSKRFYQYANRLAHGYWLNDICRVPTRLVFLHFEGETTKRSSANHDEWRGALIVLHEALGVRGRLPPWVSEVFLDVGSRSRRST